MDGDATTPSQLRPPGGEHPCQSFAGLTRRPSISIVSDETAFSNHDTDGAALTD